MWLRDDAERSPICAALGGTLQLTSPAGNGTTLLIEVPLEEQSSAVSPEP
jgi:hypothetical protein